MSVVQPVDWLAVAPALALALTAGLVLVADLVLGPRRRDVLPWLTLAGLAAAGLLLVPLIAASRRTFCVPDVSCSYVVDDLSVAFQLLVVAVTAVVVLLSVPTVRDRRLPAGEYWFLLLCSATGAAVLVSARDLLTLVVALEVTTLPTYALVGLRRDDPRGSEAALKLFLVSVVSSALSLYGIALVYAATGEVLLEAVAVALAQPGEAAAPAAAGVVLALAGFAFKVAAVPFHVWAPDTYSGAPVPVAAFLSVVSKAAGFVGLVLLLAVAFPALSATWAPVLAVVAALTMTVGNLVALRQRSAIRLLAWSSVAQSGYVLAPLGSGDSDLARSVQATTGYLLAYAVMNTLAFTVVSAVGRRHRANLLADYRGLWRRSPLAGAALAFALVSLAGLPPGLLGLFAKLVVLEAPVRAGQGWLAVVVAVNIVIGLWYYLAWMATLVARPEPGPAHATEAAVPVPAGRGDAGTPPAPEGARAAAPAGVAAQDGSVPPGAPDLLAAPERVALVVALLACVAFSLVPGPLLEAVSLAAVRS